MPVTYKEIQGNDTQTDLNVTVDGMSLILEMTYYKSGVHDIKRQGAMKKETIPLVADTINPKTVRVYLLDDPIYVPDKEPYTFSEWRTDANGKPFLFTEIRYRDIARLDKNEGKFVVTTHREGIDAPYVPPKDKLVMFVGEFIIPAGLTETTETVQVLQYDEATGKVITLNMTIKHGLDQCNVAVKKVV